MCQACEDQLKPCSIQKRKWLNKPIYTLFESSQQINRLLIRLFYFQDVTPAPLFLAYSPLSSRLFQKWPLRLVGFDERDPAIQALFQNRSVTFLKPQKLEAGRTVLYLAFSPFSLTQKEIENILSDWACQGLCILTQNEEELKFTEDKEISSFLVHLFLTFFFKKHL